MAIVLAGFLGKWKYDPTAYNFASKGEAPNIHRSSIFALALQDYLRSHERAIDKWLILGTKDSKWSALEEAVDAWDDDFVEFRVHLDEETNSKRVDQALLDKWSHILTSKTGLLTRCYLSDAAEDDAGQHAIWQALASNIGEGDEIVFDITYGLRHQPVVASFSLMLLRWSHKITEMNLYYGAAELKQNSRDQEEFCPVISVDFCRKLTTVCEAVATWEATGHYESLGKELIIGKEFEQLLSEVALADEMNRPKRAEATTLERQLKEATPNPSVPTEPLIERLQKSLHWVAESRIDQQYAAKAAQAEGQKQYFKAIAYLYEAVLIAQSYRDNPQGITEDLLIFVSRDSSRATLRNKDLRTYSKAEYSAFYDLMCLRNSVLHGTRAATVRKDNSKNYVKNSFGNYEISHENTTVENAITDESKVKEILRKGRALWKKIASGIDIVEPAK